MALLQDTQVRHSRQRTGNNNRSCVRRSKSTSVTANGLSSDRVTQHALRQCQCPEGHKMSNPFSYQHSLMGICFHHRQPITGRPPTMVKAGSPCGNMLLHTTLVGVLLVHPASSGLPKRYNLFAVKVEGCQSSVALPAHGHMMPCIVRPATHQASLSAPWTILCPLTNVLLVHPASSGLPEGYNFFAVKAQSCQSGMALPAHSHMMPCIVCPATHQASLSNPLNVFWSLTKDCWSTQPPVAF